MGIAERSATEVLEELRIRKAPVDLVVIAEHLGAQVRHVPHDGSISGMLYRDGRQVIIGVNERDVPARQRFTIAHELGHLRLHRGRPMILDHKVQDDIRVDLRDTTKPSSREEVQANAFAAELLMPQALVVAAIEKAPRGARLSEVALVSHLIRIFDVSRDAMMYRLIYLGLIAPSQ